MPKKPLQAAFKSLQNVERCVLSVIEEDAKVVVTMNCRLGVKKTFKLSMDDSNPISATYNKDEAIHRLIVRPKLLEDCVSNFASSVSEMSVKFSKTSVLMKSGEESGEEGGMDPTKKHLLTELTLNVKDFEKYELDPNADAFELVFSLRDTRPILQFCEVAAVPLQMHMMGPGQPLVISVKMYNVYEADFVLATLAGSTNNSTQSSQNTNTRPGSSAPTQTNIYDRHAGATPHGANFGKQNYNSSSQASSASIAASAYSNNIRNNNNNTNNANHQLHSQSQDSHAPTRFGAPIDDSQRSNHNAYDRYNHDRNQMDASQHSTQSQAANSIFQGHRPNDPQQDPHTASLPSQHSFRFEQSVPSSFGHMNVDSGLPKTNVSSALTGPLGVSGAGLWTEDIVRSSRMDEDDDEAVHSDDD